MAFTPRRYTLTSGAAAPPNPKRHAPAQHPNLGRWQGRVLQGPPVTPMPPAEQPPERPERPPFVPPADSGYGDLRVTNAPVDNLVYPIAWTNAPPPVCAGSVVQTGIVGLTVTADGRYTLRADLVFTQAPADGRCWFDVLDANNTILRRLAEQPPQMPSLVLTAQDNLLAGQWVRPVIEGGTTDATSISGGTFAAWLPSASEAGSKSRGGRR
jgi:hypothetical protein